MYKLWLVNKSPKDAEDINKLTYQKTGPDWSRLVFDQSWNSWNGKGPQTRLQLQSCAVLWFLVLAGPSPVPVFFQSWDQTSKHYSNVPIHCPICPKTNLMVTQEQRGSILPTQALAHLNWQSWGWWVIRQAQGGWGSSVLQIQALACLNLQNKRWRMGEQGQGGSILSIQTLLIFEGGGNVSVENMQGWVPPHLCWIQQEQFNPSQFVSRKDREGLNIPVGLFSLLLHPTCP